MGADMVGYSGGKGVLGPQSTGILCGRGELIEAAFMNSAPNSDGIGRAAKVCKEEIAGLITALELFVDTDHQSVLAGWRSQCLHVVDALRNIPGIRVEIAEAHPEYDESNSTHARANIFFESSWQGPTQDEVVRLLGDGDPSIQVGSAGFNGGISIIPVNLRSGEEEVIAQRLKEILLQGS